MTREDQYEICKIRGHKSSGTYITNAVGEALSWTLCVYCGTSFAQQTIVKIHERNAPNSAKP